MRNYKKGNEQEDVSFWQSYSDMMAALLLVFVLLIATTIISGKLLLSSKEAQLEEALKKVIQMQKDLEENERLAQIAREELGIKEEELENAQDELGQKESELADQQAEYDLAQLLLAAQALELEQKEQEIQSQKEKLSTQQSKLDDQQTKLDQIVGVRAEVIEKLKKEFANSDIQVSVNSETGAITFDSGILFPKNGRTLSSEGKNFLDKFFPKYFDVILSDEVRPYVSEVIIEGHTDNDGSYLYNLELSQARAYGVAAYCLGSEKKLFDDKTMEKVQKITTANGRSFMDLIRDNKGNVDKDASRRVEIKFRLTEQQMIDNIAEILAS